MSHYETISPEDLQERADFAREVMAEDEAKEEAELVYLGHEHE